MKTTLTIKIDELTHDDLVNFLSTATYGSDWLGARPTEDFQKMYDDSTYECFEEKLAEVLLCGGTIQFEDYEDSDDNGNPTIYVVDLNKIKKGMGKYFSKYPKAYMEVINDNEDYFTYNNCAQYIMFGEVVYG